MKTLKVAWVSIISAAAIVLAQGAPAVAASPVGSPTIHTRNKPATAGLKAANKPGTANANAPGGTATKTTSGSPAKPSHPGLTMAADGRLVPTNQVTQYNARLALLRPDLTKKQARGKPQLPPSLVEPKGHLQTWLLDRTDPGTLLRHRTSQLSKSSLRQASLKSASRLTSAPAVPSSTLAVPSVTAATTTYGTITGTVTDASTQLGLSGVEVNAYEEGYGANGPTYSSPVSATTGSDGSYSLSLASDSSYVVDFEDHTNGHLVQWWNDQPSQASAQAIYVSTGQTTANVDAALIQGGSFAGTITNGSNQALSGVCVSVYSSADQEYTNAGGCSDSNGHYQTTGVPAGSYNLYFTDSANQYVPQWWNGKAGQLEATAVSVVSDGITTVSPQMSLGGTISGTITDAASHNALSGICAVAMGHNPATTSAAFCSTSSGAYTITGLTSGSYTVKFYDSGSTGYVTQYYSGAPSTADSTPVTVTQGSTTSNIDAAMVIGGTITGTVTDSVSGLPIAGICADIWDPDTGFELAGSTTCTNSSGVYTASGIPGGYTYYVFFYDNSGKGYFSNDFSNDQTTVADGATTTFDTSMTLGGTITGTVTNSSATPLQYVCVGVANYYASGCTDSSGAFTIVGVPTGTYSLTFYDETREYMAPAKAPTVNVSDGASTSAGTIQMVLGGEITGTVTDASNNAPISNVCLTASSQTFYSSTFCTNSSGGYTIYGLPTGSYGLQAADESGMYAPGSISSVPVTQGTTTSGQNLMLLKGAIITGTVTDDSSGQGLPDVCLYAGAGGSTGAACTDETGAYRITGLPAGSYDVSAYDQSGFYLPQWYNGQSSSSSATAVPVTAGSTASSVDFPLARGGGISGTITDAATGKPLGGICAQAAMGSNSGGIGGPLSCSDATGAYEIGGLAAGSYTVSFSDTGGSYLGQWYNGQSSPGSATPVTVAQGAVSTNVGAAMQLGASVTGTVTDATTHAPIADQCVTIYPAGSTTGTANSCTDSEGNYLFVGLAGGNYDVQFTGGGPYIGQWYNGQGTQATANPVTLTAGQKTTGISAALVVGGRITGTITDVSTGKPISGACAEASDTAGDYGFACAGPDGSYTMEGLPASSGYQVNFVAYGYIQQWYNGQSSSANATPVGVTLGNTTTGINAAMVLGGSISGTVIDPSGNPVSNVSVVLYQGSFVYTEDTTGPAGTYTLVGLPAGTNYTVEFSPSSGYMSQWWDNQSSQATATAINVSLGATTTGIDATLSKGGSISGTVTDSTSGKPVAGICAEVFSPSDLNDVISSDCTDSTGRYQVVGLTTSSYAVEFMDQSGAYITQWYNDEPNGSSANLVSVTLNQDTPNINASMVLGGSITGVVSDAHTGLPAQEVCEYASNTTDGSSSSGSCSSTDGTYTIKGLPAGEYSIYFWGTPTLVGQWDDNAASVTLGVETSGVNFSLQEGGLITGHVYDGTGTPIGNCGIYAYDANSSYEVGSACSYGDYYGTDPGSYTLGASDGGALPAGSYQVEFDLPGYDVQWWDGQTGQSSANPVSITGGSSTTGIDAHLTTAPQGTISGTVVDSATKQPLTDICVYAYDQSNTNNPVGTCNENSDGSYTLTVPAGTWVVDFSGGTYITQYYNGTATGSSTEAGATAITIVDKGSQAGVDAAMVNGGTISGTVTDSSSKATLASVCVNVYDATTGNEVITGWYGYRGAPDCTNSSGVYTTSGLPSGTYKVEFTDSAGRYLSQYYGTTDDQSSSASTVNVTLGQNTSGVDGALTLGAAITGTVTDAATAKPVSDICVTLFPTTSGSTSLNEGCTGADGVYTTYNVPVGSYDVEFTDPDGRYATQWYQGATDQAGATAVTLQAGGTASGIDAALNPVTATVTGTVTDATTSAAVAGACVYLYPAGVSTAASYADCADSTGLYSISGIQPGQYDIAFFDPSGGHNTQWYPSQSDQASATAVTLTEGETDTVNETMPEVTGISGTVTDATTGHPISGVCVYLYDATTGSRTSVPGTCTDSTGSYVLAAPAGSYKVAFLDNSGTHVTQWSNGKGDESSADTVTVTDGQQAAGIDASMAQVTGVAGIVTDSVTGNPLADICVYPYTTAGVRTADEGTCTNSDGSYILPLGAGTYDIAFFDPAGQYVTQWADGVTSQGSATTVTVTTGQTTAVGATMDGLGSITGTVTQSSNGNSAYSGVCVYLDDSPSGTFSGYGACTDSSGVYTITGVAPGSYTLGYYTPGQTTGPGANPTSYWYNGASSEATATVVTVSPEAIDTLVTQSLP